MIVEYVRIEDYLTSRGWESSENGDWKLKDAHGQRWHMHGAFAVQLCNDCEDGSRLVNFKLDEREKK